MQCDTLDQILGHENRHEWGKIVKLEKVNKILPMLILTKQYVKITLM